MSNSTAETTVKQGALSGRFHAVLYGTLDNIFYVFAHSNQEFLTAFWQYYINE